MDKVKAASWEAELKGRDVAGYVVESLIDFGKSAAVFRASHQGAPVALKLFDDELIERYGDKAQLARIERELTLVGKHHPNMVRIIDGGFDKKSKNHFIVMEFLPGRSLERCLQDIPEENIPLLIGQLASCCEYLESLALVHRDIKPANIVILDDYSRLVLLDFGVMKPVGEVGVTDVGGIQSFIGTLQYRSPEFLLRQEDDSTEGWRALSLYQIGGVLHDLIMRRPLFQKRKPVCATCDGCSAGLSLNRKLNIANLYNACLQSRSRQGLAHTPEAGKLELIQTPRKAQHGRRRSRACDTTISNK